MILPHVFKTLAFILCSVTGKGPFILVDVDVVLNQDFQIFKGGGITHYCVIALENLLRGPSNRP